MATPIGRVAASAVLTTGLIGAAVLGSSAGAAQPETTESYVVVMAADPVVAYDGGEPGLAPTEVGDGEKLDVDAPEVEDYVEFLEGEQLAAASGAGVDSTDIGDSFTYAVSGFEADLTDAEVAALERDAAVAVVVPNDFRQLQTDSSVSFLGLDGQFELHPSGFTGEDVVIGVIDSGIWPEHPSFADDGSYAALPGYEGVPCEFGASDYNADDQPFTCNDKLLGARDMRTAYKTIVGPETFNSARDYDGHGTHVAGTAAGNAGVSAEIFGIDRGVIGGIAPRARVIAYSACGDLGCVTSDLVAAIDAAVADGVDVINYSIGGGATLTDPADIAFLFAADAGVWVATSAGNDGPDAGTVGGPGTVPWITTVGASSHDRTYQSVARFGNGTIATGASVTAGTDGPIPFVDAADVGNELCDPDVAFTDDISGLAILCLRGGFARVDKSRAVAEQGGAAMVLYNADDAQAVVTDLHFVPSTHISFSTGLAAKEYIAAAGDAATVQLTEGQATPTQPSVMADFSARGPNAVSADIIKPDVTAPGVNILAGHTPFPTTGAGAQLFQSISGTSMSSPHVAGLFALIRQANPEWSAAMAKSAIMTTARQDVVKEDGVTPADPFDMGAGQVDPAGGARWMGTILEPGLLYDADLFDYFAFLCGTDPSVFLDPASVCGAIVASGQSIEATDLNLPSIGAGAVAGSITIERTVTSATKVWRSFRPIIEAPPGFEVEVSKDRLRVGPGDTDSYELTITNVSAPIGEWAHGSITWKSGGYEVRSPISVRATLLDAPGTVAGFGGDGTVAIPTQFGFDGPYTASPHGPAEQVDLVGTVGQDPDQDFDPADPVGVTTFDLTTSGVAYSRILLDTDDLDVPDPDVDIDLYVLNSAGDLVGVSTAGGTNEQVDLLLPPDDTYTLFVHGWQTGGAEVGFTIRSFDVPLAAGTGSLTIDSAPTEVSLGESTIVTASWSDLEPDANYLGAVSHADASGLIGLTLVEITT